MSFDLHRFHQARDRRAVAAAEKQRDRARAALAAEHDRRVAAEQRCATLTRQLDECRVQREALRRQVNDLRNVAFGVRYGTAGLPD